MDIDPSALLSDELREKYGDLDIIIPSKKIQPTSVTFEKIYSKSELKKQESIREKKEKFKNRAGLLEKLAVHSLPTNKLVTLHSTKTLGKLSNNEVKTKLNKPTYNNSDNEDSSDENKIDYTKVSLKGTKIKPLSILSKRKKPERVAMELPDSAKLLAQSLGIPVHKKVEIIENEEDEEKEYVAAPLKHTALTPNGIAALKAKLEKFKTVEVEAPKPTLITPFKTKIVKVNRLESIQTSRMLLPIYGEEQSIMEIINENPFVLLCGETGSGKTTQVPQFLYEAGYGTQGLIGITQPRRVAAIAMAKRVSEELNLKLGVEVGYQIRYDLKTDQNTTVKFMTDGVLLKEIQHDFLLKRYSVIILDEAHERNLNTDILIGLLSRIVPLRNNLCMDKNARDKKLESMIDSAKISPDVLSNLKPLRVIIMSASLRVSDFVDNTRLFPNNPPPVINVKSRQYPVTMHFSKNTPIDDYLDALTKKVIKIHKKLPAGGILIFLTGKRDIEFVCKSLTKELIKNKKKSESTSKTKPPTKKSHAVSKNEKLLNEMNEEVKMDLQNEIEAPINQSNEVDINQIAQESECGLTLGADGVENNDFDYDIDIDKGLDPDESDSELKLSDSDGSSSDSDSNSEIESEDGLQPHKVKLNARVLPLYSLLSTENQMKVFDTNYDSSTERLIVVSTNVAETSITIPNIKYVVDAGREKIRHYDRSTGLSQFKINWISKASAQQRAGRAGRISAGHCYRLFSSAVFDQQFDEWLAPEISRLPIDGAVLHLKSMGIHDVANFPYPTLPDRLGMVSAIKTLSMLGALSPIPPKILQADRDNEPLLPRSGRITELGKTISIFPVAPRFAKILALSDQGNCSDYIIAIVASLSVEALFLLEDSEKKALYNELPAIEVAPETQVENAEGVNSFKSNRHKWNHRLSDLLTNLRVLGALDNCDNESEFCKQNFLLSKSVLEIQELRSQLTKIIRLKTKVDDSDLDNKPATMNKLVPPTANQEELICQLVSTGFVDRIARKWPLGVQIVLENGSVYSGIGAYQCLEVNSPVFIYPNSALCDKANLPDYISYIELVKTKTRVYMKGVTAIKPEWLSNIASNFCMDNILKEPSPFYDDRSDSIKCFVETRYGPKDWVLPRRELEYPNNPDDQMQRSKFIAKAFLDGKIFQELVPRGILKLKSSSVLDKQNRGASPFIELFFNLDTKKKIVNKLINDPIYSKALLKEYLKWIQDIEKERIINLWPSIFLKYKFN